MISHGHRRAAIAIPPSSSPTSHSSGAAARSSGSSWRCLLVGLGYLGTTGALREIGAMVGARPR